MKEIIAYPSQQLTFALYKMFEIAITILLMMGIFPLFKELLVYLLMKLYEIFVQHQYLF